MGAGRGPGWLRRSPDRGSQGRQLSQHASTLRPRPRALQRRLRAAAYLRPLPGREPFFAAACFFPTDVFLVALFLMDGFFPAAFLARVFLAGAFFAAAFLVGTFLEVRALGCD